MLTSILDRAVQLDAADPLASYREQFHFPLREGKPLLYFTGNSLGLQPTSTQEAVDAELEDWRTWGVDGHMKSRNPWFSYHQMFKEPLAKNSHPTGMPLNRRSDCTATTLSKP